MGMAFLSPMMGQYSATQEVEAANWVEDCNVEDAVIAPGVALASVLDYEGLEKADQCRVNTRLRISDEQVEAQEVYSNIANVTDYKVNSERLTNSLIESNADAVRNDAEVKFVQAYLDQKTLSESVAVNHEYINSEYTQRGDSLVSKYNRDLMTGESAYNQLSQNSATQHFNVYVDGEQVNAGDGSSTISFSIGPVQEKHLTQAEIDSGMSFTQDTGVTETHADGSTSVVGTITVDGTTYSYKDNLAVTLTNPSDSSSEVVVVGQDSYQKLASQQGVGADAYTPDISPSDADIVVSPDGSGDYTSIMTAVSNTAQGDTVYIKPGTYTTPQIDFDDRVASNVTIVADDATVTSSDLRTVRFSATVSSGLTIRGLTIRAGAYAPNEKVLSFPRNGATVEYTTVHGTLADQYPTESTYTGVVAENVTDGGDIVSAPEGVTTAYQFTSYAQETINEQETARSEMISNMGDASSGYLSDLWAQFESGASLPSDVLTYEQMYSNAFTSEEGYDSLYWYDAQYQQAGIAGHDLQYTIKVEVPSGSTVYANAKQDQSTTLSSSKTYKGHLWTDHRPSSGSWESGTTYSTSDLGGKVFLNYMGQEQFTDSDGNLVVETTSKTVAIEGEFTITELRDSDGNTVETVEHNDDPSADPYDASTAVQDFNESQEAKQDIQEGGSGASEGGDDGSGAGAGSGSCGITLFGICSGISSFQISMVGGFIALVVAGYVFRPVLDMLRNFTQ